MHRLNKFQHSRHSHGRVIVLRRFGSADFSEVLNTVLRGANCAKFGQDTDQLSTLESVVLLYFRCAASLRNYGESNTIVIVN